MELSKEVINILEYLAGKIGVTIDWTSENVLPYIEQLCEKFIMWEVNTSFAWIAIMWCVAIITLIFAIIIYKLGSFDGFEWFVFGCVIVAAVFVTGTQVFDIIECKTFPEKTIYDYIQYSMQNR